ncbi:hypothetical protein GCM10029992_56890 [Glycomyces albus]
MSSDSEPPGTRSFPALAGELTVNEFSPAGKLPRFRGYDDCGQEWSSPQPTAIPFSQGWGWAPALVPPVRYEEGTSWTRPGRLLLADPNFDAAHLLKAIRNSGGDLLIKVVGISIYRGSWILVERVLILGSFTDILN